MHQKADICKLRSGPFSLIYPEKTISFKVQNDNEKLKAEGVVSIFHFCLKIFSICELSHRNIIWRLLIQIVCFLLHCISSGLFLLFYAK